MSTAFTSQVTAVEQGTALKARLAGLAHLYCNSTIGSRNFTKSAFVQSTAYERMMISSSLNLKKASVMSF